MNHLVNIIRKELRELLTPGSVASVLIMVMLFAGLGTLIGGEVEKAKALPVFGIANWEDGTVVLDDGTEWDAYDALYDLYEGAVPPGKMDDYIKKVEIGTKDIYDVMKEYEIASLIVLEEGFSETVEQIMGGEVRDKPKILQYYLYEPTGMFGSVSSTTVSSIVSYLNTDLSATLIKYSVDNKEIYPFLANPIVYGGEDLSTVVNGKECKGVTPQSIASAVSSSTMMVPIIIMIIIMMVGSIVISSMGSEKENKTLETLLTLPIRRTTIVTGKIVAAAVVGLVYGAAYMIGMSFYMNNMLNPISSATGEDVNLNDLGLALTPMDYAILALSMFLAIICALGICMIMGAFAKNYKSAQTMTMPLSIMAMLPMFVIMFSGWYGSAPVIQAVTFAIPFSHPMIAVQSLMYSDYTLVFSGIAYMVVFAFVMILITVRIYRSDILITGLGQNKTVQTLLRRKRIKRCGGSAPAIFPASCRHMHCCDGRLRFAHGGRSGPFRSIDLIAHDPSSFRPGI